MSPECREDIAGSLIGPWKLLTGLILMTRVTPHPYPSYSLGGGAHGTVSAFAKNSPFQILLSLFSILVLFEVGEQSQSLGYKKFLYTSSQDGGVGRHNLPSCATKINITIISQNKQHPELSEN